MGATAISSVMRSVSMRRRTSSRSKRRCSRTVAPASAAASRLSRPRMCDGGVATWKRSSGPRPEGRAPVGGGVADRPVRVAHRLGQPGRARAEDQDTSSASAVGLRPDGRRVGSGRGPSAAPSVAGVVEVGDGGRRPGARRAARPPGRRRRRGAGAVRPSGVVDLDRLPRRAEQHGGGAELADGVDHGDELDPVRRHHRHPVAGADAAAGEVPGEGVGEAVEVAEGPALVARPGRRPGRRSGPRPARAPRCIRARRTSETLFSADEIDVNTGDECTVPAHGHDQPRRRRDRPRGPPRDHRDRPPLRGQAR